MPLFARLARAVRPACTPLLVVVLLQRNSRRARPPPEAEALEPLFALERHSLARPALRLDPVPERAAHKRHALVLRKVFFELREVRVPIGTWA